MLKTVSEFLSSRKTSIENVTFCLWSGEDLALFEKTLALSTAC